MTIPNKSRTVCTPSVHSNPLNFSMFLTIQTALFLLKGELIVAKRKTRVHKSLMKDAKPELKKIKARWRELRALGYLKNYPNRYTSYSQQCLGGRMGG